MDTLLAETPIHVLYAVSPLGGSSIEISDESINEAITPSDAFSYAKWLGDFLSPYSASVMQTRFHRFGTTKYVATTRAESSSNYEFVGMGEWSNLLYLNPIMPTGSGEVAQALHPRETASLVIRHMDYELKAEGWKSLNASIDRWARLPLDWDGEEGIPPPRRCIFAARRWLNIFAAANLPHPSGYVAGDGEIGFRWRTEKGFASVSLLDDGTELAFCRVGQSEMPYRMEAPAGKLDLYPFIESVAKIA